MERKIIFIIIIYLSFYNLFSIELDYVVSKKSNIYEISDLKNKKIGFINKGENCEIKEYSTKREIINGFAKILVKIKSKKISGWIFSENLIPINSDNINKNFIGNWTHGYYFEAINNNSKDIIENNEFSKEEYYNLKEFWKFFNPQIFIITNSTISYSSPMAEPVCFIQKVDIINNNNIKITGFDGLYEEELNLILQIKNNKLNIDGWDDINFKNLVMINNSNEIIEKLEIIREEALVNKIYTPTIPNLRFRETPTLDGKFIRMLRKDEKLELIEKGKTETIGDAKGTWVKVRTEKGEIGWCFDAYLKEIGE